jgi:light-regulated signal transduction histidine kinase (bacteriophytochrome)
MINELLEFTRGSQNPVILAQTNYGRVVEQVIEELRPEVGEKHVEIVCKEFENLICTTYSYKL